MRRTELEVAEGEPPWRQAYGRCAGRREAVDGRVGTHPVFFVRVNRLPECYGCSIDRVEMAALCSVLDWRLRLSWSRVSEKLHDAVDGLLQSILMCDNTEIKPRYNGPSTNPTISGNLQGRWFSFKYSYIVLYSSVFLAFGWLVG